MVWLAYGFINLSAWQVVALTLVMTHVTIASVTIYLHRHQAHRSLDLHPAVAHFFRLWLWLSTGMQTKEWAAIHRKHHAKCETAEDPHSPQIKGIETVFWKGAELYRLESKNTETMQKYGHGTPDDWLENNVYSRFPWQGVAIMLIINLTLFGAIGLSIWAVQMLWIPVTAAGVINGIGHYWGYRNFEAVDASTNISPWGILIGGEELHNNHHTYPTSAKLSVKPYEFDIGWLYIRVLETLHLANVKKTPPKLAFGEVRPVADEKTLEALIMNRYEVMAGLRAITKRVYQNMVQTFMEVLNLTKINRKYYDKYIKIPNIERIQNAAKSGRGTILLTGHYGDWEMSSLVSSVIGFPIMVLARIVLRVLQLHRDQHHPCLARRPASSGPTAGSTRCCASSG